MRSALAERLLVKIMDWSPEEIAKERPLLQALANLKYDEYQQFSPGIRYIESLVKWLNQFENVQERKIAYDFLKKHLIFITNEQISHLVNICFTDKVNPILIEKTARLYNMPSLSVRKIADSEGYKEILRRSLFIGLSDGSRIDQFRRSSNNIDNEQVLSSYHTAEEKVQDMLDELKASGINKKFNSIFLIDDFTASGTSYFRFEDRRGKGKIFKFLSSLFDQNSELAALISNDETIDIHILFFLATEAAVQKLQNALNEWESPYKDRFVHSISAVQIIGNDIKENVLAETQFIELVQKYFDETIVDKHFKKGNHEAPYLGFNECSLPLILNHNTPNNSLPILWFPEDKKYKGLFPRVTRHK